MTEPQSTEITVIDTTATPIDSDRMRDLRSQLMTLAPDQQRQYLAAYDERRKSLRDWLRAQLKEGTHFGHPPGLEPIRDERGWYRQKIKGSITWYPPERWTPKPSLYKAGADFICDLMGVQDRYNPDLDAWKQLGSPDGTFVFRCCLFSKANGDLIGEGWGARKLGEKGGDVNNSIKMAKKSSKVDAVLNAYALSDLFTQDLEDLPAQSKEHEGPKADPNAPQAQPRNDRATHEELKRLKEFWKETRINRGLNGEDRGAWDIFAQRCGIEDAKRSLALSAWTKAAIAEGMKLAELGEVHVEGD